MFTSIRTSVRTPAASLGLAVLVVSCSDEGPTTPSHTPDVPAETSATPSPALLSPAGAPGLLVAPFGLDFGDVDVGSTSTPQAVAVTNLGSDPVVLAGTGGDPAGSFSQTNDCEGASLAAGASCTMTFTFESGAPGPTQAAISGAWNGASYEILLRGTGAGPSFRITPTGLDFGEVAVGSTLEREVDVTNTGSSPVEVSIASGGGGAFGEAQNCQGTTLAPGASCQITYTFAPTVPGEVAETTAGSVNGQPFAVDLRGVGVGPRFRVSPTAFDFGEVVTGTSHEQSATITNIGSAPVDLSMAVGGADAFGGVQNCQGTTLDPGASCQITYTFAPQFEGEYTAITSGTVNGQSFGFTFVGWAIESEANRTRTFRITPTRIDFGEVSLGASLERSVAVTNMSAQAVTLSMAVGSAGPFGGVQDCQGTTLDPGASCHLTYTFAPEFEGEYTQNVPGSVNGQSFQLGLRGDGVSPRFRIGPTGLDFGQVPVGGSLSQSVEVTNIGPGPAEISMADGVAVAFGGVQDCQGTTLDPGASCQITYTFAPTEPGEVVETASGSVNGQGFAFTMRGEGIGLRFRVTPFGLDFGRVDVGDSTEETVSVTNIGPAAVEMSGSGGGVGAPFGGGPGCQGTTLDPGASCQMVYTFTPDEPGPAAASTSGAWNGHPFEILLRGEGWAQVAYTFGGFMAPIGQRPRFKAGTAVPVRFRILDEAGDPIPDAEAETLVAACSVTVDVVGSGDPPACAGYGVGARRFDAQLRLARSLAPGTWEIRARAVLDGGGAVEGSIEILVH